MEYNELITRVKQLQIEAPDTDRLLTTMRCKVQRRQRQRIGVACLSIVMVVGILMAVVPIHQTKPQPITLAEQVSRRLDVRTSHVPAPITGYRHSIKNHHISTLL